jgi:hypothetical protein
MVSFSRDASVSGVEAATPAAPAALRKRRRDIDAELMVEGNPCLVSESVSAVGAAGHCRGRLEIIIRRTLA